MVAPICGWVTSFTVTHKEAMEAAALTSQRSLEGGHTASEDRGHTSKEECPAPLDGVDLIVDLAAVI
jgi:hypothetical protein